jgi:hypothetical protein
MEVPFKSVGDPDRNGRTIRAKKRTHPEWDLHFKKNQVLIPYTESGDSKDSPPPDSPDFWLIIISELTLTFD